MDSIPPPESNQGKHDEAPGWYRPWMAFVTYFAMFVFSQAAASCRWEESERRRAAERNEDRRDIQAIRAKVEQQTQK